MSFNVWPSARRVATSSDAFSESPPSSPESKLAEFTRNYVELFDKRWEAHALGSEGFSEELATIDRWTKEIEELANKYVNRKGNSYFRVIDNEQLEYQKRIELVNAVDIAFHAQAAKTTMIDALTELYALAWIPTAPAQKSRVRAPFPTGKSRKKLGF
jgi:hypothetical protein